MGFKVIITQSATQDLAGIVDYIAADNAPAAQKLGEAILNKFESLAAFPYLGRMVPERGQAEWRELPYKSYRLIYHVNEQAGVVEAARVWHAARGEPEF